MPAVLSNAIDGPAAIGVLRRVGRGRRPYRRAACPSPSRCCPPRRHPHRPGSACTSPCTSSTHPEPSVVAGQVTAPTFGSSTHTGQGHVAGVGHQEAVVDRRPGRRSRSACPPSLSRLIAGPAAIGVSVESVAVDIAHRSGRARRGGGVGHVPGIHIGLGQRVRRRARRRRSRRQRRHRAGDRARPRVIDDADRSGSRCRCWSPGSCSRSCHPRSFPVGVPAVLVQRDRRRRRRSGSSWCRSRSTSVPAGGVPGRGGGVVDHARRPHRPGSACTSPCTSSTHPAPTSSPGRTPGRPSGRPPHTGQASRCRCWSPRSCSRSSTRPSFPVGVPACLSKLIAGPAAIGVSRASRSAVTRHRSAGYPVAVAVFTTCPASTSAWVTVYVAVQVVDAAGANVVTGQDTAPTFGSSTAHRSRSRSRCWSPRSCSRSSIPAAVPGRGAACLSNVIDGPAAIGVVVVSVAVDVRAGRRRARRGRGVVDCPASTSAWVTVYVAVHVVDAPGASVVTGQVTVPTFGSSTLATGQRHVAGVGHHEAVVDRRPGRRSPSGYPRRLSTLIAGPPRSGCPWSRSSVTSAPVGGGARGGGGVRHVPGIHIGLGHVYVAVHVVDAPGASVVTGQDTAPDLRVIDTDTGPASRCRCWSPGSV